MKMPLETAVWLICQLWVGVLQNAANRSMASDAASRPGASMTLIPIVGVVLVVLVVFNQVCTTQKTG